MTQKKRKTTVLKLAFGPSVRRVRTNDNLSVAEIHALVKKTFPELKESEFDITYIDDEQDTILIATDSEVEEATLLAASSGKCIRFNVKLKKEQKKKAAKVMVEDSKSEGESDPPVIVERPQDACDQAKESPHPEHAKEANDNNDQTAASEVEKEDAKNPSDKGVTIEVEVNANEASEKGANVEVAEDGEKAGAGKKTAKEASGKNCGFGGCWKKHRESAKAKDKEAQAAAEELRKGCEAFLADEKVVAALIASAPVVMSSLLAGGTATEVLEKVLAEQPVLAGNEFAKAHLLQPARALTAVAGDLVREGGVAVWEVINELGLFLAASQEPSFDLASQVRALVQRLFAVLKRGLDRAQVGVHWGVSCDRSGQCPIIGKRYNLQSANYDLCAAEYAKLAPTEQALFTLVQPPVIRPFRMLRKLARMAMGGGGSKGSGGSWGGWGGCPLMGGGGGGFSAAFGGVPAAFGRWQDRKANTGNWRGSNGRRGYGGGSGGRRSRSGGRHGFGFGGGCGQQQQQQQQQQQPPPQPMEILSQVLRSFGLVQMGPAGEAAAGPPPPKAHAREMEQLKSMGFANEDMNQALLEELKGDVDGVVARIIQELARVADAAKSASASAEQ